MPVLFPTSSPFGFFSFYLSVKAGQAFWAVETGEPERVIRLAQKSSATALKASPAQLAALVDALGAAGQTLPHVRMRAATAGCVMQNLYGSTEATVARLRLVDSDDPFDAGQPFPHSRVQIVDEHDTVPPDGQIGRIRHSSAAMVHEYLGNPDAASLEYDTSAGLKQIGVALVTEDGLDVQTLIRAFEASFGGAAARLGRQGEWTAPAPAPANEQRQRAAPRAGPSRRRA